MNTLTAGVLGYPVEHTLSPRLHSYWLKLYGIDGTYEKIATKPEELVATLRNLAAKGYRGVNLTVPHKEAALKLVDEIDPLAESVGAINTIIMRDDGGLLGCNTDVFGFSENLRMAGLSVKNKPVTLLGAGGAARAAIVALMDMGASDIRIMNRTPDRAEILRNEFGKTISVYAWGDTKALKESALLANATSLGLKGQPPLELALDDLPKTAWVTDMVYAPLITPLLERAAARGYKTVDGLGMLLHQARPAFQAFFGRDPQVTAELRAYVLEGK